MKLFGSFEKIEAQDDGTLMVTGIASSEAVDSDGEVVKASAIEEALPDYMRFGAVREMHQPSAAGTAVSAKVNADGKTEFTAHVVDPVAVKKVQTGTYKGFSIGGKITKRDPDNAKLITALRLNEISLVDRPANPEAVFSLCKIESDEEPGDVPVDIPAAAESIDPAPVDDPAVTKRAINLRKGMYSVQWLADILQTIASIAADAQSEAIWEGDGSSIPADVRTWLQMGVELFKKMSAEEADELIASVTPASVERAESTGDLEKAGARHSKADKDRLQAIHDHAVGMGADCSAEKVAKVEASSGGELAKLAADRDDALAKVATLEAEKVDALAKVATISAQLDEMTTLSKQLLEKRRAALRVVDKTADQVSVTKVDGDEKPESELTFADEIKKSFQNPQLVYAPPTSR